VTQHFAKCKLAIILQFSESIDIATYSHLSYPERLAVINLEPIELRRLKNDLVMYYKCLNNFVALPSDECICQQNHAFHTRSGGNRLMIPLCSTNHF